MQNEQAEMILPTGFCCAPQANFRWWHADAVTSGLDFEQALKNPDLLKMNAPTQVGYAILSLSCSDWSAWLHGRHMCSSILMDALASASPSCVHMSKAPLSSTLQPSAGLKHLRAPLQNVL